MSGMSGLVGWDAERDARLAKPGFLAIAIQGRHSGKFSLLPRKWKKEN
jgi:hypothetical protein